MRKEPPRIHAEALEPRLLLADTRFAVIGDYGYANPIEQGVAERVKSWRPEFIITTGDNNYPLGEAATIDANIGQYYHEYIGNYHGAYGAGSPVNRFFPALGNHDWYTPAGGQPNGYVDYFTLPGNERYYDFVAGPVHFFAIDSDPSEPDGILPGSVQGQWLQAKLAASTSPWNLVYFHHPPYTSGLHQSDPNLQWPFKAWGADAVLNGHDHTYERIIDPDNGFTYIVNGLGGTPNFYPFLQPYVAGSQVRYTGEFGAMNVVANDSQVTFQFINRHGEMIDSWTLNASATVPASPTGLSATPISARQVDLTWSDGASDENGFRVERSIDGGAFEIVATLGPNVTTYSDLGLPGGATLAYRVRAFNTAGDSAAYSNTAPANTPPGAPPGLAAPADFTAAAPAATEVDLNWEPVAGAAGYKIERSADGIVYTPFSTAPADATSLPVTGLAAASLHYFRIRAFDAGGDSPYANVTQATPAVVTLTLTPDLSPGSDSGVANDDNVTNIRSLTFTGGAAPAGAVVRIYSGGVQIGSSVAAANGTWSITAVPLVGGVHLVTARFIDPVSGLSPASDPLAITIDLTAPRVTRIRYNDDLVVSNNVRRITVGFDEAIHVLPVNLKLRNDTSGQNVPAANLAVEVEAEDNSAQWTFPGRRYGLLENGNYTATLAAATTTDLAGNPLDGDGNGQGGDARSFTFTQLVGDVNGDRVVNRPDLKLLLGRFNAPAVAGDPADLTGDGRVRADDYQLLELNYGKSVPAPAANVAASSTSAPSVLMAAPRPPFAKRRLTRAELLA